MAIYLFSQILKFTYNINLIEKLSIRYFINSSDVFVIKGFTAVNWALLSLHGGLLEIMLTVPLRSIGKKQRIFIKFIDAR